MPIPDLLALKPTPPLIEISVDGGVRPGQDGSHSSAEPNALQRLAVRFAGYFPAVVGTALPIVFIRGEIDAYVLPRASIVIAGACLGVGLALVVGFSGRLGPLRLPLAAAAGAAILACAFSVSWQLSLTGSYLRYDSLPIRLSYLGLFVSAVWLLRDRGTRDWLVAGFVFGTCVSCVEAVQQWYVQVAFRPDGNLGNANLLAALVAMALPLALQRALRRDSYTLAWAAAIVVLEVGWWVTTSRSGAFGILAGCLTLAILSTRGRLVIGTALATIGVLAAGMAVLLASPLRVLNNDPPELRLHLWEDALRMIAARPLTGWGEESTGLAFGHFLSQDYATAVTFDRIHNGPLDIAATQGLLGLAAIGTVLGVVALSAWRRRLDRDVAGLAAALVGYSVWVLFNFDWAPVTGVFWLLAGALWSAASAPREVRLTTPKAWGWPWGLWRPLGAVALMVVAIVLGGLPVMADIWATRGRADLAVQADPLQAQYHWWLGDILIATDDIAGGIQELSRAADLGETEPGLYVDLGDAENRLGRLQAAREAYRRALQIAPYYPPALGGPAATAP